MNKILISGIILLVIVSLSIFIIYYTNSNIADGDGMINENMKYPLQKITYSISGDSTGSYMSKKMQHFDNYDLLTVISKTSFNAESITKEYKLPNNTLELFTHVINKYNYRNWDNLPESDSFALDAGIHSIIIEFSNNELYTINQYKVLPQHETDLFDIVSNFLNGDNKTNIN